MAGRSFTLESLERRTLCAAIVVNTSQTAQTIAGLGGDYARAKYGDFFIESDDTVGQYNLANLAVKHARIGIPVTDGSRPMTTPTRTPSTWPALPRPIPPSLAFSAHAGFEQPRHSDHRQRVGCAELDGEQSNQQAAANHSRQQLPRVDRINRRVSPGADEVYGVKIDYLSLNEADGGFNLKFSSTDEDTLIKMAGPKFAQLGLSYTPKWLVGDTGNAQRLVAYATPILSDPAAAAYLGPISFHAWDSLTYSDATLTAIAALGQQYNKPIWCEEVGFDANAFNETPAPFPTWTYAIQTAEVYNKVLKLTGASVADYWEFENDFPCFRPGRPCSTRRGTSSILN